MVRVSEEVIDTVSTKDIASDHLVEDRFPIGESAVVILRTDGQLCHVRWADLELLEDRLHFCAQDDLPTQMFVPDALGKQGRLGGMRERQVPSVVAKRRHS